MRTREVKSYLVSFTTLPRPVFWFNDDFQTGTWSEKHVHPAWAELAYAGSGCMVVCGRAGSFLVPPHRAVWIPPGVEHEWYIPKNSHDRSLYVAPEVFPAQERFSRNHIMEVSPLLREIILELAPRPHEYETGPVSHLVDVLLDQLAAMPEIVSHIRMPMDHRLLTLCTTLLSQPDSSVSIKDWATRLAMSERNLGRLFRNQTGMPYRVWRQNIRLHFAYERLKQGENVTAVAFDSGYSSISAFIESFKKLFGTTPGKLGGHASTE